MSDERKKAPAQAASWLRSTFWDEVEHEIERVDWDDFVAFLKADTLQIPIRSEFREELRGRLRDFIRIRYSS
jgi:hypothetical protein